ncbi:MAG: VUT family protein [Marivita sp.]
MADARNHFDSIIAFALFASTIPAANWLIGNVGSRTPNGPCVIPVGFGLMAPSGVLMIGLALVLRDWLHELAGCRWSFVAVLVGGALSALFSPPELAVASASAFTLAEMSDLTVYARLRKHGKSLAVMASQVVGAAVDSALFVFIAFGSLEFSAGTTLAKIYAGAVFASVMWLWGRRK